RTASRRMGRPSTMRPSFETRTACAPQDEVGGWKVAFSSANRTYAHLKKPQYNAHASFVRGRRLKRRSMAERGATANNAVAMERREAQGSLVEGPRASGPPPPRSTWVPESWREMRADRKARKGSLASSL